MQVQHLPMYQFLEGSGKSFVIPVYQRDYAWKIENCQKLWDDLVELSKNKREDHFLGTLVTIASNFQEYSVIDGQQRLTTISILLVALLNFLKSKDEKTNDEINLENQITEFLINRYSSDEAKRIRLKPNKLDKDNFDKLFENEIIKEIDSNIFNNYTFFTEKIKAEILSPRDIFDNFLKLKIVLINLDRKQDDPQLIFESLNSTGVDLTSADLIRNYILMDLEPEDQEKQYKKYWIEIEKLVGDVAEFIRNYLIFKLKNSVKKDDVYYYFKKFARDNFGNVKEEILSDLLKYSKTYSYFIQNQEFEDIKINERLKRLNKLEFTVCYPYLLDVFTDLNEDKLSSTEVIQVLHILESYVFRKLLVDNTTQGLNKMFVTLSKEIKKEGEWDTNYCEILNFILLEKRVSQRFPNDEEFEAALITKEIYKFQSKNKNFLLESLENYKSAYSIDLEDLTIEHIMPQNLTNMWKKRLGDNYLEIHSKYLHTLGNLSLTSKNSELSNNDFDEKQKIDFQISRLKLNFSLDSSQDWGEEQIVSRARDLIKDAKKIWPYPKTNYSKPIPEEQIFDLSTQDSFTGTKPMKYYFNGEEGEEVNSWRELFKFVCRDLLKYSPTDFNEVITRSELKWYFDIDRPIKSPIEFAEDRFVEGHLSADSILYAIKQLCKLMNYDLEKIQFSLLN